jgi:hypothetical protein
MTELFPHCEVEMRNVTISLDEDLVRRAKVEAARRDLSLSKYIAALLEERLCEDNEYQQAWRRFSQRPLRPLRDPVTPLPAREDLYDRSRLR